MMGLEARHRHSLGKLRSVLGHVDFGEPVAAEEASTPGARAFSKPRNEGGEHHHGRRRRYLVVNVERHEEASGRHGFIQNC